MRTSVLTKSVFAYTARPHRRFGLHRQRGKVFLGELDERGMVYPSCIDEYHPVIGAAGLDVRLDIGSFDQLDVLRGPRMVRPRGWPIRTLSGWRRVE